MTTTNVTYTDVIALAQSVCDMLGHNDVRWRWFSEEMQKIADVQAATPAVLETLVEECRNELLDQIDDLNDVIADLKHTIDKQDRLIAERDRAISDLEERLDDAVHGRVDGTDYLGHDGIGEYP